MQQDARLPWQPYPELSDAERLERARGCYETLRTRRSCRAFSDQAVPRAVIEQAILAAGTAPSGANHQPWHFAAIESPEAKAAIRVAAEEEERQFYSGRAGSAWLKALRPLGTDAEKPFLEIAPWLIVPFAQRRGGVEADDDLQNYYVSESVGLACGMLLATLHCAGLATLIHTPNPMRFLNRVCQRPEQERPMMIIVVGHAAADATIPAHALRKKSLDQISSWI
ncbi:nitroreductase family protein [Stakelama tenebrarum]|uniref:Nitroreductase family protein n=1 Tax=Stakelama tenebrarum TaxID=2711215 RepID=A0A6G6YBP3_9SPHN|nr:nitroreductase family protein [Sphingosinithalassobacter tenebrarum]QIG82003.1 nitroreductase family protein [Sphingosinithalassobacter tenebrarum]